MLKQAAQMIKYKEFWFALSLLALIIFYCFLLKAADDIGQYWVQLLHPYAQAKHIAVSDKAIYVSQTRDVFIRLGSSIAFFLLGLIIEIFFLKKRLQTEIKSRFSVVVFCLAISPVVFTVGRELSYMYKMGRLF
ncbi:MAG: hypothetical protein ACRYG7_12295 [Janthinobacterium lividum]